MSILSPILKVVTVMCFILALTTIIQAQASRTYVSGVGNDADPCSRTAPCRTWSGAFIKTAVHGEINALDPGGYGSLTITKSITINGAETNASTLNAAVNAFTISFDSFAGTDARKSVRIRNLSTQGFDTGTNGIRIIGGVASANSEVLVENVFIDGNNAGTGRGISDERSGGGELFVNNVSISNCSGTGIVVIPANSGATRIDAVIINSKVFNCAFGIVASSGARMTVTNTVVVGNTNHGFGVEGPFGAAELQLDNCVTSSNGTGILQAAGGTVRVANTNITNNKTNGTSGVVNSFGNNRVGGNAGATTLTPIGVDSHDKGQQ